MAFATRRTLKDGSVRWYAKYLGADGKYHATHGEWASPVAGRLSFADYVEQHYWPTAAHLEVSTRAAYRCYLDKHFIPRFGAVVSVNPCTHTELPKVVSKPKRIITVAQFDKILAGIPARYRMLVLMAIETGMRWGELIALRPHDIDFDTHVVTVRRTIVEVARKHSPSGERLFVKDYPKDDEQRLIEIEPATCQQLREHMLAYGIRDLDLLFTSSTGTPISRNNFRTKYWTPAVKAAQIEQTVTFHNLRAAHASWLLAGGADILVVQERLGHRRITTTQQYTGTLPDAGKRALTAYRKIRAAQPSTRHGPTPTGE